MKPEINGALNQMEDKVRPDFRSRFRRKLILSLAVIVSLYLILNVIGVIISWPGGFRAEISPEKRASLDPARLNREIVQLEKRLASLRPKGIYILIDSGANRLLLKKGDSVLREAVVSCGSGSILEEPGGKRRWIFDTPRGEFAVKSKIVDPAWVKPDWAFIEEGKEPPKDWKERIEPGVLGDYALGFGNGYFIHGTLYTRLLGRNVTHGCIRVGDEDLEVVFRNAQVGTKIYIY